MDTECEIAVELRSDGLVFWPHLGGATEIPERDPFEDVEVRRWTRRQALPREYFRLRSGVGYRSAAFFRRTAWWRIRLRISLPTVRMLIGSADFAGLNDFREGPLAEGPIRPEPAGSS